MRLALPGLALLALPVLPACSSSFTEFSCRDVDSGTCVEVDPLDDSTSLLDVVNTIRGDTTVVLGEGTFTLDNQVTFRGADNLTLRGQGMDLTTLDFGEMTAQGNGVDVVSTGFTIEDLTILDAPKDGLRIEDSNDVVIRRVRATWTNENDPTNGGYGLYPVRSNRVLMEGNQAFNASDAGIYVGQCIETVVRNNIASRNVAGLEIENTQYADVYGNEVTDNTGGLVVFDLPGNPIVGRDVYVHDNIVTGNNRPNFAPGGVVSQIPAGTGTFAMASRRVEITGNTYADNNTVDIALISGFVVESDPEKWAIANDALIGSIEGLTLDEGDGTTMNYRSTELWVHGNSHSNSGTDPDDSDREARELGFLMSIAYGDEPVDTVLYDGIGESSFDVEDSSLVSNDNRICVGDDPGVTVANMNLEDLPTLPTARKFYRPDAPFEPYNCEGFESGPMVLPTFLDE